MPSSLIAGLFLVAAAAALAVVAMSAVLVDDQIVWGAIALAVFCTGLLVLMSATTGGDGLGLSSWRIGSWSLVWGALAFGLATITWVGSQTGPAAEILPASILRALWMLALAMAMLTAGYCAGPYRFAVAHARRAVDAVTGQLTDDIRGQAVPWVLFGIGVAAQLGYALLTGHLGYIGDAAAAVTTASGYSQYLAVAGELRAAIASRRPPCGPTRPGARGRGSASLSCSAGRSAAGPSSAARRVSWSRSWP